jgi:hypothetical protein
VARLTQQVGDNPTLLTRLNRIDMEGEQFAPPEATSDQHGEDCVVPFTPQRLSFYIRQQAFSLFHCQPVSKANAKPAHAFHASNACGQFRTEQARIRRFEGNSPYGPQGAS